VPNNVRVSSTGDSHAAGRARLRLKLAAIGYVNVRHGVDADVAQARAARTDLRGVAIEYYEAVTGIRLKRPLDHLQFDNGVLERAAIAYVNARHGVDADTGLARAGLALLAQAAMEYYEMITGADPKQRPVDPHLQLSNGA
jgi:hypothetical protein